MMKDYLPKQQKYIDSVGGYAHSTAVQIIGTLEIEIERLRNMMKTLLESQPCSPEWFRAMDAIGYEIIPAAEAAGGE